MDLYMVTRRNYCVLVFLTLAVRLSLAILPTRGKSQTGVIEGDIFLGGLFRIHRDTGKKVCANDTIEVQLGIQRMEAMVYAIQRVNEDPRLLPNVTLGAEIRDTCSMSTVALEESLKFILDSLSLRANSEDAITDCVGGQSRDVVGVVGASRSTFSVEVAKLLRLFSVPQVSYASTSAELSDHEKYSYFARTVPPDTHQALAMLDIVRGYKWNSVFTVNSKGSYGEQGIGEFKRLTRDRSPCIVFSVQVNDKDDDNSYDEIIENFKRISSTTRIIVLFVHDNHAKLLLKAAMRRRYNNAVWIASDDWGVRLGIVHDLGTFWDKSQAITISLPSPPLTEFKEYFRNLTAAERRPANPWFQSYWKQENCTDTCTVESFNDKLAYVMDAVYAFAYALHDMYKAKCPAMTGICDAMKPVNGTDLRDRLLKVKFKGESTDNFEFNKYGDSKARYILSFFGKEGNYIKFGEWQNTLRIMKNLSSLEKVTSTCDDECFPWSRRMKQDDAKCCAKCSNCTQVTRQYINREDNITCISCKEYEKPNSTYDGCEPLPLRYIPREWVIIVSVFAALGILFTLLFISLFLYNFNTPIVRASGRDLMFPLFLGVLLNYTMTFFLISKPTDGICGIQRFGFGFSSSICYASVLLKTNRIARIFNNKSVRSISFTKPQSQMLILILLIAIEVSLVSVGIILDPPHVIKILPTEVDVLAKCNTSRNDYAISLPYNLLLVIFCTIYAFRTRKMPSSFNEAKYLGFVMYTTCIIWIAFLPVFYGTAEHYQPIALSLNTTLNATTILVFLFGPKIYIMVFSPDRNTQSSITTLPRSALDIGIAGNRECENPTSPNSDNKMAAEDRREGQVPSLGEECKFNSEESPRKASHIYTDNKEDDKKATAKAID